MRLDCSCFYLIFAHICVMTFKSLVYSHLCLKLLFDEGKDLVDVWMVLILVELLLEDKQV